MLKKDIISDIKQDAKFSFAVRREFKHLEYYYSFNSLPQNPSFNNPEKQGF